MSKGSDNRWFKKMKVGRPSENREFTLRLIGLLAGALAVFVLVPVLFTILKSYMH